MLDNLVLLFCWKELDENYFDAKGIRYNIVVARENICSKILLLVMYPIGF
ncbi:MAG: hypothetical protein K2I03_10715 [Lachnospiraceae bacterium]|nr:hypothetical protein [Lachnospiraceae bacterium]